MSRKSPASDDASRSTQYLRHGSHDRKAVHSHGMQIAPSMPTAATCCCGQRQFSRTIPWQPAITSRSPWMCSPSAWGERSRRCCKPVLMDIAGDSQSLAAALNHSDFNIGRRLSLLWLGGMTIAGGYGKTSTGYVGAGIALGGPGDVGARLSRSGLGQARLRDADPAVQRIIDEARPARAFGGCCVRRSAAAVVIAPVPAPASPSPSPGDAPRHTRPRRRPRHGDPPHDPRRHRRRHP